MGHSCIQCLTYKILDYTINAKNQMCEVRRISSTSKCDICGNNLSAFQVSYYPASNP